jgi:hypothetical protein
MLRAAIGVLVAAGLVAVLPADAGAARAHLPFRDGPATAARVAAWLAGDGRFSDVACFYDAPHVRCRGHMVWTPVSGVVSVTITLHRRAVGGLRAVLCIAELGVCRRLAVS